MGSGTSDEMLACTREADGTTQLRGGAEAGQLRDIVGGTPTTTSAITSLSADVKPPIKGISPYVARSDMILRCRSASLCVVGSPPTAALQIVRSTSPVLQRLERVRQSPGFSASARPRIILGM